MKKKFTVYIDMSFEASIEDDGTGTYDLGWKLAEKCEKLVKEHMNNILCPRNEGNIEKIKVRSGGWGEGEIV